MKKIFIALAVAVALIFTVAPSQARLGGPDLEPGADVVLPFFIASMPGFGNVNTLLVITDFRCGLKEKSALGTAQTAFHYTVYTRKSATVYDDNMKGTPCDIVSTDALTILNKLSAVDKAKLEYDMDGDGVSDTYVGYIYFDQLQTATGNVVPQNSVGAQILLVDLAKGMASSANAPVKEYSATGSCASMTAGNIEVFSPDALADALAALTDSGAAETCLGATNFGLYPRYYVNSANGACWFFMWKSFNNGTATGFKPYDGTYHVYWYDNEEHKVSASLDWPYELLILNVNDYIPAALWASSTYPKEGFVAFELNDISGVGFYGDEEFLGYTWLKDVGAASESWTVLNPMWRYAW